MVVDARRADRRVLKQRSLPLCFTENSLSVPALPDWPKPESSLLEGIVDAIRARSKAFKKNVRSFDIGLEIDFDSGSPYERLNLKLGSWSSRPDRLTFVFWDDGNLWVDARQSSKNGWEYELSFYGYYNDIAPDVVRDMIERSLWINQTDAMQKTWSQCKPYTE